MAVWKLQGRHIGTIAVGSFLFLLLCPFENRMSWNLRLLVFWVVQFMPNMVKLFLINIDWLYWCLLFVPFYAFYICVGEKLFMLKSHVTILQQDVSGKTKFIEWQNMALSQLDLRLGDLSKEVELLRRSNENFRKEEESWRKNKELMKKKIREQQKFMSRDVPIVREQVFNTVRQEILTLVKKNKSESLIKNKKRSEIRGNTSSRKEEESWRKNKELMKKKIREQQKFMSRDVPIVREQVFNTVRQEILTLVKKNKSESLIKNKKLMEEEASSPVQTARSSKSFNKSLPSIKMETKKCTSQEWERARMRLMERSKRIMKNRAGGNEKSDDQYDKMSEVSKASEEEAACLSTVHESETDDSTVSIPQSAGSKSVSNVTVHNQVCLVPPVQTSRSSYPINKSFTAPGVPGYELREFGESKVKSYTEVFKRKVHVPTGGSGPRITIEGQRRWCF